jgi:hypothetical protein
VNPIVLVLLALGVILFIILAWVVIKWLFIIAIVLGLIWVISFFWRGIGGGGRRI